jgi:lipopolysaccharide transport system ATP-binding protein
MSNYAIQATNLTKQYHIGGVRGRYKTLRDTMMELAYQPFRRAGKLLKGNFSGATDLGDIVWALEDVSFDVTHGEVVGVIGRNGAGKSTLLKILSRITEPTSGIAAIRGRVGSLLEVGAGFHSELTGRENMYLNGAILGMTRVEIDRKFDEIVDFSGIEKFIDTPVKHYSTGMYLRLAFAVAAHLEPEILLVDEVLAVGDIAFQKKCLGKMKSVASEGRTVIFVSHNMAAVSVLCSSALVLEHGRIIARGSTEQCIGAYLAQNSGNQGMLWQRPTNKKQGSLCFTRVVAELSGEQPNLELELHAALESSARHKAAFVAVDICDLTGIPIMQALPQLQGFINDTSMDHSLDIIVKLPPLIPGQYFVTLWVGSHNTETLDEVKEAVTFEIVDSPTPGRTFPHTADHGHIVPASKVRYANE